MSTVTSSLFESVGHTNQFRGAREHVLFHGDVRDLLKRIPDQSIQLIVTSPPYNIGKEYERSVPLGQYLEAQMGIADELVRVLRPEGSLCWQVGNFVDGGAIIPLDIPYFDIFSRRALKLRNRIVWTFNHGLHATRRFSGRYETILWFTKSDEYTFNLDEVRVPSKYPGKRNYKPGPKHGLPSGNPRGKNPSDMWRVVAQDWESGIWDIPNVKANHPEKTVHPCQFPVELVQRCILALTNAGDLVLDPFMGSGSSIVAAELLGRFGVGAELDPSYVETARARLTAAQNGTIKIRPIGKPIHTPGPNDKVAQVPSEWK